MKPDNVTKICNTKSKENVILPNFMQGLSLDITSAIFSAPYAVKQPEPRLQRYPVEIL